MDSSVSMLYETRTRWTHAAFRDQSYLGACAFYIYRNKDKIGENGGREGEKDGEEGRGEGRLWKERSAESCIGDNGNKSSVCVNFIMEETLTRSILSCLEYG